MLVLVQHNKRLRKKEEVSGGCGRCHRRVVSDRGVVWFKFEMSRVRVMVRKVYWQQPIEAKRHSVGASSLCANVFKGDGVGLQLLPSAI